MVALPQIKRETEHTGSGGCGTRCGEGLEKVYPTTAVRFGAMNWLGEFSYRPGTTFRCGAKVVIRTERGTELGQQVSLSCNGCNKQVTREQIRAFIESSGAEFYRLNSGQILREATADDLARAARHEAEARQHIDHAALLAAQLQLDMKVLLAERLLGGERLVFYFRADQRVDFRELVRELARHHHTRIEMRQVGPRDEARIVADYEICGRECCCKNFLKKMRPVTMRMAKIQKATLDPSQVSGRCGRLRCCLRYEHESYESLAEKLPRVGAQVELEDGVATVVDRQILTQLLFVRFADNREMTVPLEDVKRVLARGEAPPADEEDASPDGDAAPTGERSGGPRRPTQAGEGRPAAGPPRTERPLAGDAAPNEPRPREERTGRRSRRRRRGRLGQSRDAGAPPGPGDAPHSGPSGAGEGPPDPSSPPNSPA